MNNKNRIPFDWEKYQSGEFEAVCRDGKKVLIAGYNPKALDREQILGWLDAEGSLSWNSNGLWDNGEECDFDIFLTPKPKKFQAWVNLYSNGNLTYHLIESESESYKYTLATKGIETIETRLIEWEG